MTEVATPIDVSAILQNQYKPATVDKEDDLLYDLGNLTASDFHPIDISAFKSNPRDYLQTLSRDNTQLLFARIFSLPTTASVDGFLAELPRPTTSLPREKPIPKAKPETKWEKYAKMKGIKKVKKDRKVWDEEHKQFRPRYGGQKANDPEAQWVIEHKPTDDPNMDPFTKMKMEKKERVNKQNKRKERNQKAREQASLGTKVTAPQMAVGDRKSKLINDLGNTLNLANFSTASVGKFNKLLPGETKAPVMKGKRKLAGISEKGDGKVERDNNLKLMNKMFSKEDALNADKAANKFINKEQRKREEKKLSDVLNKATKKQKRK